MSSTRLSFVVEVGLSESTWQLCLDARSWLETACSSVKPVVTIGINHQYPKIILCRWELVDRQIGVVTRSNPPQASCTAMLRLSRTHNRTFVTGESCLNAVAPGITQLNLPFDKIVGRTHQQHLERDLVISEQKLRFFAEKVWKQQNLM